MKLRISESFSLPLELATLSIALLAIKGRGKSYTAAVLAEELMERGVPICFIDPEGANWGLKSSADGKSEGYQVTIFGGDHADLPLEEGSGEVLARAIVERRFNAIIDLSHFRKNQIYRFLTPFLETFHRLNRQPIHLFFDEADRYAPQKSYPDVARCLGAMEDIVRRGRSRGIGSTLITQRPASINKDVLTQCDCLMALGIAHPRDIAPVMEWIRLNATPDEARAMLDSLPTLPVGTAWIWAPSFGIFERVKVRKRTTFDSSATPKIGEARAMPKVVAKIDLEALGQEIKATVERAKENDPKELKAKITRLEALLKQRPEPQIERIEVPIISLGAINAVESLSEETDHILQTLGELSETARAVKVALEEIKATLKVPAAKASSQPSARIHQRALQTVGVSKDDHRFDAAGMANRKGDSELGRCERAVLTAIVQFGSATKARISIVSGYSGTSSSFANALGALRSKNYIAGGPDDLSATSEGIAAAGEVKDLPTGDELLAYWMRQLGRAEASILGCIAGEHPKAASKELISEVTGYSQTSSSFANALGKLRTLELITRGNEIKASESLFG